MSDNLPAGVSIETVYVVEADYGPEAASLRPAVRPQHLARVAELLAAGRLIEAGGFLDLSCALLVVRAATADEAVELARDDVYVTSGVWTGEFRVRPFGRVVARQPEGPGDHQVRGSTHDEL